jgi:transcriptional antiterminator NusG
MTSWSFQVKSKESAKKKVHMKVAVELTPEDAAEWSIRLLDATGGFLFDNHSSQSTPEFDFFLEGSKPKELRLEAHAPIGSAYKDRVVVKLEACMVESPSECDRLEFTAEARQSILALKTSIGHEKDVADGIGARAKSGKSDISAILAPTNLRGYVLIEGMNTDRMRDAVKGVRKAHSFVDGEMNFMEIDHYLAPKPLVSGIMEGDVVELVAGPFKGEKARVQNIDEAKEEITVELFEAMVPIPVTVRGDHVRVLEKER